MSPHLRPWATNLSLALFAGTAGGAAVSAAAAPAVTSTFWDITRSGTRPVAQTHYKMCAETPVQDMLALRGKAPEIPGVRRCDRAERKLADGSSVIELVCRMKMTATVSSTWRTTVSGTAHDVREHVEIVSEGSGLNPKPDIADVHYAYLGACPSNLKPGDFLNPNGEIYHPPAP